MTLTPAREKQAAHTVIIDWMKRHSGIAMHVHPQTQGPDGKTNEDNFKSLVKLLSENAYVRAHCSDRRNENTFLSRRCMRYLVCYGSMACGVWLNREQVTSLPATE